MNYPYATGNIKALESKLLDRNKLFVLSKCEKSEFVKTLLAMNYGDKGETIEELIANEMAKTKDLIDTLTPARKDTDLFYLLNDAQNIKIIYKIKKFGLNKFELLNDNGSVYSNSLNKAIIDNDFEELDKSQIELIENLNKKLNDVTNPKIMSFIIDNEVYNFAVKKTSNKILLKYLNSKIDLTNVISMIRAKNLNWSKDNFLNAFIDTKNNELDRELFVNIYDQSIEDICHSFSYFYSGKITKVLKEILQNKEFNRLEIEFDKLCLDIMNEYQNDLFTIGPMIYYYLLKKAEAQNIRTLYSRNDVEIKDLI